MLLATLPQCATPRRDLPPVAVLYVVAMMDRLLQHCKQVLYRCNWKQKGRLIVQVPTADGSRNREKKASRLTQEVSRKEGEKPSMLFVLTRNEISEVSILPVQIIKI